MAEKKTDDTQQQMPDGDSQKHVQPFSDDPKLASKAGMSGGEHADESDAERAASPEKRDEVRAAEMDEAKEEDEEDEEDDKPKRGKKASKAKAPTRLPYHRITPDGPLHVAFPSLKHDIPAEDARFACHGCGSTITGADLEPEPEKDAAEGKA